MMKMYTCGDDWCTLGVRILFWLKVQAIYKQNDCMTMFVSHGKQVCRKPNL